VALSGGYSETTVGAQRGVLATELSPSASSRPLACGEKVVGDAGDVSGDRR
jgi:hypothetical protein